MITWPQAIGILAFVLNVWGNLALTRQKNHGHVVRLLSNACWLIYSPLVGAWALLANHATFAGINLLGYYRWKQIERVRAAAVPATPKLLQHDRAALSFAYHREAIQALRAVRNGHGDPDTIAAVTRNLRDSFEWMYPDFWLDDPEFVPFKQR